MRLRGSDMNFTQEDKETIYNSYMRFVNSMCDDLDSFSEIGPKELVYAVLALVEDKLNSCKHEFQREGTDYCVINCIAKV
jgi:hypothetical protein